MADKHTPERWTFVPDPTGKYGIYPTSPGGKFIAITDTREHARLIAAAPELLEALEKLLAEAKGMLGFAREGIITEIGITNVTVLEERIHEAEAAIRKAKGESQ